MYFQLLGSEITKTEDAMQTCTHDNLTGMRHVGNTGFVLSVWDHAMKLSAQLATLSNLSVVGLAIMLSGCQPTGGALVSPPPVTTNLTYSNGGTRMTQTRPVSVLNGASTRLFFHTMVDIECSVQDLQPPRITQKPQHGVVEIVIKDDFTSFKENNPRVKCNTKKVKGYAISYRANAGYRGEDFFALEGQIDGGRVVEFVYNAMVQ